MTFHAAILLALVVAGAALGAAVSGGLITEAPAGPQPVVQPVKYYDPLP
jgi:hypothetical protein